MWYRENCTVVGLHQKINHVFTFVGAEEVQEIFFLRDQDRALIKQVAGLKQENRRSVRRLEKKRS